MVYFLIVICYINVWLHEFWHFAYATVILKDQGAYITYLSPNFLAGYCNVSKSDTWLYYIGGLGSALSLLIYWLFLRLDPCKCNVPVEAFVFATMWVEFVYGLCEGTGFVFKYPEETRCIMVVLFLSGCIPYLRRVVEYLHGGG